ncbi:MAG: hypothetical protein IPI73_31025 [Betaproteobacteria bacterium]|nr:hypothetical protein [Betaproteobacteria bacterium]
MPAAFRTGDSRPFCTTSTVIASGHQLDHRRPRPRRRLHDRPHQFDRAERRGVKAPEYDVASAPTSNAPIRRQAAPAHAPAARLSSSQATTIGAAISRTSAARRAPGQARSAGTHQPMPITIGIGTACIARLTQPLGPSTSITTPVG